ncbi:MAG: hypothetical protein E7075_05725 [Bacteroidales bacterium]|nr:hypothetical protein [Bacteroidales bacterium]
MIKNKVENISFDITVLDKGIMRFLVSKISSYAKVRSVFVVGSMSNLNYKLKTNNDYDIRLLVDVISEDLIADINSGLHLLQSYLTDMFPDVFFTHSCLVGPVRHVSKVGTKSILLHCLVMRDVDFYSLPAMHQFSYAKNYRLINGEDLLSQIKLKLSLMGIIKDSEGIEYCIEHISKRKITYLDWKKSNDEELSLIKITTPFTLQSGFEFLNYSIKYCTQNLRLYLEQEHLLNFLDELSFFESEFAPFLQYSDYIENVDLYTEKSLYYLKKLLLFAKKINRYETSRN